jgi:putative PEP-CTERM system TPR-repeat lipoprotein
MRRLSLSLLSGVALAALIAACDDAGLVSVEDLIARAQEARAAGDSQAAVIDLKSALAEEPNNAAAHFLLGQVLLDIGDGASADKEFQRAIDNGMKAEDVVRLQAKAWLTMGEFQQVLDRITVMEGAPPITRATQLALRAEAMLGLGRVDEAKAAYAQALSLDEGNVDGHVGAARVAMSEMLLDTAQSELDRSLAIAPKDPGVRRLAGDLAFIKGDYEGSAKAYGDLVAARATALVPRIGLARAQIALGKWDDALATLGPVTRAIPDHPMVNYLRAVAAYYKQDYELAASLAAKVGERTGSPDAILLAGTANAQLGRLEQASVLLERYASVQPDDPVGRRLLGALQLRLAQPAAALESLEPLLRSSPHDRELLTLVGSAAVRAGNVAAGTQYFERAVAAAPKDEAARTALGLTRIAAGDTQRGLEDLEQAALLDPTTDRAQVTLILALLSAGQFERALVKAEGLRQSLPESSLADNLAGAALLGLERLPEARASFEAALAKSPADAAALNNLATLDVAEGKVVEARQRYQSILAAEPGNLDALFALATLDVRAGDVEAAEASLRKAVETHPDSRAPRVYLARFYVDMGRPLDALTTVQGFADAGASDPSVLEVTGRAQMMAGETASALGTFRELAAAVPDSGQARYLLALAYEKSGDLLAMRTALEDAIKVDARHFAARIALARLLAYARETDAAAAQANALKALVPEHPEVLKVDALVAMVQDRPADAIAPLEKALAAVPQTETVLDLANAHWRSGDADGAIRTLETWIGRYPTDLTARAALGNFYGTLDRLDEAEAQFAAIVEQAPDSVIGRNNLADILVRNGAPDRALEHARRALELAPGDPTVLDTLGQALLLTGDLAGAEQAFRDAAEGAGNPPTLVYHLSVALVRADKKDEARRLLRGLLDRSDEFLERDAAKSLLAEIGG